MTDPEYRYIHIVHYPARKISGETFRTEGMNTWLCYLRDGPRRNAPSNIRKTYRVKPDDVGMAWAAAQSLVGYCQGRPIDSVTLPDRLTP